MTRGCYEPELTSNLVKYLKKSSVFVNVGANIGYYTCLAAHMGITTYAVEPLPSNIRLLEKNIIQNDFEDRVKVLKFAASDIVSTAKIYGSHHGASLLKGWANSNDQFFQYIDTNTIDNIFYDFLKSSRTVFLIDVEGHELSALRGAVKVIEEIKPIIFIEISIDEHLPDNAKINPLLRETFDFLFAAGYSVFAANNTQLEVTSEIINETIERQVNLLNTHNFICIHNTNSDYDAK